MEFSYEGCHTDDNASNQLEPGVPAGRRPGGQGRCLSAVPLDEELARRCRGAGGSSDYPVRGDMRLESKAACGMASNPDLVRSADGTKIAVVTVGEGQPVVLIGGAFNDRTTMAGLA